ncbi:MAG TPA: PIN domain-containing protein [Amycolatopsis sp.]|nr:PIN domain-containing protein [Amycolatopsis sp.]
MLQKIAVRGGDPDHQALLLTAFGITVEPLTAEDAAVAARIYPAAKRAGLSLADRCCLALAIRLRAPALTADKAWLDLDLGAEIELIR